MATREQLQQAQLQIDGILAPTIENLTSNPKWGTITFEDARGQLELMRSLAGHLRELPIELIPDAPLDAIISALTNCRAVVARIQQFDLEKTGNPKGDRDTFAQQARDHTTQLLMNAQQWISFLAYQKGDVNRNIQALSAAVNSANRLLDAAQIEVQTKKTEVDDIIKAAREAAGKAGVAVFTQNFAEDAKELRTEAKNWLHATAFLGTITLAAGVISFAIPLPAGASNAVALHLMSSKLVVLFTLLAATIWCGRIYKATLHQAAASKHRANALRTFEAFVKAAADETTRDAVLLETTRSIFAPGSSGYLDGADPTLDTGTKVLEIFKGKPAAA
jgi:hypothetical protein